MSTSPVSIDKESETVAGAMPGTPSTVRRFLEDTHQPLSFIKVGRHRRQSTVVRSVRSQQERSKASGTCKL
jgi:hypothetical protein